MTMRMRLVTAVFLSLLTSFAFAEELDPTALRGDSIFMFSALKANGGVVLQAKARFIDTNGKAISLTNLSLGYEQDKACLYYQKQCYEIEMEQSLLVAMATWISRHRTAAFSQQVFMDDEAANAFVQKELVPVKSQVVRTKCVPRTCYVPREFHGTDAELILYDLDFTKSLMLKELTGEPGPIMKRLNGRTGVKACEKGVRGSYINTDVDSAFVVKLTSNKLAITGVPYRYFWSQCPGGTLPYVRGVAELSEIDASTTSAHDAAINFARTVALLRAFEFLAEKQLRQLLTKAQKP